MGTYRQGDLLQGHLETGVCVCDMLLPMAAFQLHVLRCEEGNRRVKQEQYQGQGPTPPETLMETHTHTHTEE